MNGLFPLTLPRDKYRMKANNKGFCEERPAGLPGEVLIVNHIKIVKKGNLQETKERDCRECQTSCQSACKTSCTVGNQLCRQEEKP